jgi:undecaprenyl pyrophosphate synthase
MLTISKINEFIKEDCPINRAKILKEIKDSTDVNYIYLSLKLYDSVRNLKRLYKLNNLIPEYVDLLKQGIIKKIVAYELSNLDHRDQFRFYEIFKEKLQKKVQAKDMLSHLQQYQEYTRSEMEINIFFDNKSLMDSLADEIEKKEKEKNKDINII